MIGNLVIRPNTLICAAAVAFTPISAHADIWSIIRDSTDLSRILDGRTAKGEKGKNWIKVLPNGDVLVHTNRPGSHGTKVFHNGRLCDKGKGAKPAKNKGKSKFSNVYGATNCAILQKDGRNHIRIVEDLGKGAIINFLLQ
jgi:hypothetical protein